VAVAFDNARLFAQSQESLENLQRVYREISQQAWSELLKARGEYTIRCDEQGLVEAPGLWYPEMEKARQSDQIVQATDEQATIQSLVVPIKVRGNVIGVLDTRKGAQTDPWTPEQITMLETITAQIGQALESAQLYEGTQLRAESERLAGEITSRMRETLDIDAVLQTAAREFRRALNLAEVEIRLGGGQSPTTEKLPSM
jgi:GAF domain-containing protein